jgi:GDP-L-fucose synthase
MVADVVGYRGKIIFDPSKPDGTPRKLLDISLLSSFGWTAEVPLREGLKKAYANFLESTVRER